MKCRLMTLMLQKKLRFAGLILAAPAFVFGVCLSAAASNVNDDFLREKHGPRPAFVKPGRILLVQAEQRKIDLPNTAGVSVELIPGPSIATGSKVSFRVTTKKSGYLLLVDVDAAGKMSQIFPSPELLAKINEPALNRVTSGQPLLIPSEKAKKQGFEFLVTPPVGPAAIVAILSEKRVQVLDLPDERPNPTSQSEVLNYLKTWTAELRIPNANTGKLDVSNWSFDVKPYVIQPE